MATKTINVLLQLHKNEKLIGKSKISREKEEKYVTDSSF